MSYNRKVIRISGNKRDTYTVDGKRIYPLVLDMDTVENITSKVKFKQYDYGTSFINIQLTESGYPIDLRNVKVVAGFKDSKGKVFTDNLDKPIRAYGRVIIIDEGIVKVEIPKEVLRQHGDIQSEIVIFDIKGNRSTSPTFIFYIQESIFNHEEYNPGVGETVAICGKSICGEVLCGEGLGVENKSEYTIKSYLSDEFKNKFGGGFQWNM